MKHNIRSKINQVKSIKWLSMEYSVYNGKNGTYVIVKAQTTVSAIHGRLQLKTIKLS